MPLNSQSSKKPAQINSASVQELRSLRQHEHRVNIVSFLVDDTDDAEAICSVLKDNHLLSDKAIPNENELCTVIFSVMKEWHSECEGQDCSSLQAVERL